MIKNKVIVSLFGASLVFLAISAMVAASGLPQGEVGSLILRFDKAANQAELFGGIGIFYGIFGVVIFIVVANLVLALIVYEREKFLSYMLGAGTLLFSTLFSIAAYIITSAN